MENNIMSNTNSVENFIASVQADNHADAKQHFDSVIASKVSDAFEAKKVELASRIGAPAQPESDQSTKE
jgi:hypothetical protein